MSEIVYITARAGSVASRADAWLLTQRSPLRGGQAEHGEVPAEPPAIKGGAHSTCRALPSLFRQPRDGGWMQKDHAEREGVGAA